MRLNARLSMWLCRLSLAQSFGSRTGALELAKGHRQVSKELLGNAERLRSCECTRRVGGT